MMTKPTLPEKGARWWKTRVVALSEAAPAPRMASRSLWWKVPMSRRTSCTAAAGGVVSCALAGPASVSVTASDLTRGAGAASRDHRGSDEIDHERDEEERKAGRHQGRHAEFRGLAVTQCDQGGNRAAAALQDVRLNLEDQRKDHEDCDRLTERTPEPEHRPADDPTAPEREDHHADHAPPRRAKRVCAFPFPDRRLRERFAHHRAGDRHHHQGDDEAGDQRRRGIDRR